MDVEKAVVATLSYADVFDYPLSLSEIFHYLIAEKPISYEEIKNFLDRSSKVFEKNGFYCFSDRKELIAARHLREQSNKMKMEKAKRITRMIGLLPTISLIGVSGAVSMQNAKPDDDIDFFIIVKTNTLWITRLFVYIFLSLTGSIRFRNKYNVKDKICLNMLIDESVLSFPKVKQTVYTAHEIVQMKPLIEKNDVYKLFIESNAWVANYLPNALDRGITQKKNAASNAAAAELHTGSVVARITSLISLLEFLAQKVQLWYMKARTREEVNKHLLAFHPRDYEHEIMQAYRRRIQKYEKI